MYPNILQKEYLPRHSRQNRVGMIMPLHHYDQPAFLRKMQSIQEGIHVPRHHKSDLVLVTMTIQYVLILCVSLLQ